MDNERLVSDARDFYEEVISTISSSLSDGETIERDKFVGKSRRFCADAFLEKGSKRLGLTANTYIEVKSWLTFDIGARLLYFLKEELDKGHGQLLVICRQKLTDSLLSVQQQGLRGRVTIWTYDELKAKTKGNEQNAIQKKTVNIDYGTFKKAKEDAINNKISLFLGAGVSMDAKLPSWNKLLEALLKEGEDKPFDHINEANANAISNALANSSIVMGRYVIDGYQELIKKHHPDWLSKKQEEEALGIVKARMREALYSGVDTPTKSELVKAIVSIARKKHVENIITYNFDDLIETELNASDKFESIYNETFIRTYDMKPIYHVHGYLPRNDTGFGIPVLSETEYHRLYSHMHHWANVVQLNALYTTTCFFIGFSMTDPNQRRLLDLARNKNWLSFDPEKPKHYVFLKRQKLMGEAVKAVNDEHCKQIETMMLDLGLNVIWFDDFKDLPKQLLYVFEE